MNMLEGVHPSSRGQSLLLPGPAQASPSGGCLSVPFTMSFAAPRE